MVMQERAAGTVMILDVHSVGHATAPVRQRVEYLLGQGYTQFVVNLGAVRYLDSAGLGEIISAYKAVRRTGGNLKLFNASPRVHRVLTLTKLLTVVETFSEETDAVDSFASPAA